MLKNLKLEKNVTIRRVMGLKCSYFEVIKVTQFFEFFQFKNNKAKFKKFCGLRFAKPTSVKQLAIIVFIDCYLPYFFLTFLNLFSDVFNNITPLIALVP